MIVALGTRVLIKLIPRETKVGSIFVPDTAQRASDRATVISIGELVFDPEKDFAFDVGDEVYFARYSGSEVKVDDDEKGEYMLVDVSDIYAKEG